MKSNKYWVLTFLALLITLGIGLGSYFLTYEFSKEYFLKSSLENALNYAEVSAVSVGSKKKADEIKEILERAPYIKRVEIKDGSPNSPYELKKEFLFPDGKLNVVIELDKEMLNKRASSIAKNVSTAVSVLTGFFLFIYLVAIKKLYLEPLSKIKRDIDRIYKGTLEKIPLSGKDEFGKIRESINRMIDSIKDRDKRAEIISQFIQLLTVGKGFNGEFIELMRKVLKLTKTDGVIIGIKNFDNNRIKVKLITQGESKELMKELNKLEGIEPYILELGREVETTKVSILSREEQKLGIKYVFGIPLTVFSNVLGYVIFFRRTDKKLTEENKNLIKNITKSIAISVQIKNLIENLQKQLKREKEFLDKVIKSLIRGIEIRDSYTRGHSERVAFFSKRIAQEMGLPEDEVNKIYIAALLHDIGKIGIPDSILLKPGKLTDREYEIIKLHPILSYELLKNLDFLKDALDGIKYHHERWDGSGYPEGLKGEEIPLPARIIAVADSYDAMTSKRIYREALDRKKAINEIRELSGKSYDPEVVRSALPVLLEEPPEPEEEYLEGEIISEIEERRLDYFLRDSLTGVFNRNALELAYQIAKDRFKELSGIVVDIIKLREINIKEGWEKGDEILKKVVNEIQKRTSDVTMVRYSGDNFLLFTPREKAKETARVIKEIEEETSINLRVVEIPKIDNIEKLQRELTELEFEGSLSSM
ncbi:diguanylate cyclase (GGDEF)-like protein [Thermovibrio guaymasensis]|uniref:Diguanylate cyclase (GGDEF)-like protein n=1 Tax=Thermovibrio guaymasensis TaxID=240167 RepID=A0A420W6L8_9BACT|nr:HD domain-containing phosphohydrolase [Thermovibrio guaymasensis]RKQ61752.1 diguanylate cyclase (GGDEF)-like protein [Thermovibrio guaymasensis]